MASAHQVVEKIAKRYGVRLVAAPDLSQLSHHECLTRTTDYADDYMTGPQYTGFSARKRLVGDVETHTPEVTLHEITHCVLGHWSTEACEAYLLMPFEWAIVQYAKNKELTRRADIYQEETTITRSLPNSYCVFHSEMRDTAWWRNGLLRAQSLGLLDSENRPTFKWPRWYRSGVMKQEAVKAWDYEHDHEWPVGRARRG